jgi:hypothetical protein
LTEHTPGAAWRAPCRMDLGRARGMRPIPVPGGASPASAGLFVPTSYLETCPWPRKS